MPSRSLRTFWAIRPPDSVLGPVGDLVRRLRAHCQTLGLHVAWVSEESMHITLKFLGNVAETAIPAMVERVRHGLASLGLQSGPRLRLKGLAAFPSLVRPSVLFVGIDDQVELLRDIQSALEGWLEELGFAREARPFHPHLTLGRVRERRQPAPGPQERDLRALYPDYQETCGEPFVASELTLYESRQGAAGMSYVPLAQVPLCGAGTH